jgi:hypothetical protein
MYKRFNVNKVLLSPGKIDHFTDILWNSVKSWHTRTLLILKGKRSLHERKF